MLQAREKVPICLLIGAGSKLPAIIKAAKSPKTSFKITLVVSHRAFSRGVELAIAHKIPAIYFKLPDYRKRLFFGRLSAREDYMSKLGWFIAQREYSPKLLVFAGWDLVMDINFFRFFKANFGNGYAAINLHPGLMPMAGEGNKIKLPDGSISPVIKGEQQEVLEDVIRKKLTYFGPSVHFMVAGKYDVGMLIGRSFIKISKNDTVDTLRKKLMPVEDRILIEAIQDVVGKYILK